MKSYLIVSAFIACTLLSIAYARSQKVHEVGFNLGGGPIFHTDLDADYKYSAYSLGGSVQLNFFKKRKLSIGIQAGVQQVVEKFQITEYGWHVLYQPYLEQPGPMSFNQPEVWISKYHLWQFLLISNYHFPNNILLEGSMGTNLFIENDDRDDPQASAVPLIGLGGGYQFKITRSLSIPVKLITYFEFTPEIKNRALKINGGSLYPGVVSGILFNLN